MDKKEVEVGNDQEIEQSESKLLFFVFLSLKTSKHFDSKLQNMTDCHFYASLRKPAWMDLRLKMCDEALRVAQGIIGYKPLTMHHFLVSA